MSYQAILIFRDNWNCIAIAKRVGAIAKRAIAKRAIAKRAIAKRVKHMYANYAPF